MTQTSQRPQKKVLIIDDTLDMELQKHRLLPYGFESMHNLLRVKDQVYDVDVEHATSRASALRRLQSFKEKDHLKPEDVIVICDYKLQPPEEKEDWGPDILTAIAGNSSYRPKHLFLMSKSGFRGEDRPKLDAIGAKYFHANELFYIAAHAVKNEALKEVFSQRAKGHVFRQWCNDNLGTAYPLAQYRSSDVKKAEIGRIPVSEVMRRIAAKEITHAEAMQLLDEGSVRDAFRVHVDSKGMTEDKIVRLRYGVEGPSVQGRLAFSSSDIDRIKKEESSAPIVLVLDHDYSPKDHDAITQSAAVIMLGSGTQHIPVLAKNLHIPVLYANRGKYEDLSVKEHVLQRHDGIMPPSAFARAGDWVTVDGATHSLYANKLSLKKSPEAQKNAVEELARIADYHNLLTWHYKGPDDRISDHTGVRVYANADNAEHVALARKNQAIQGVGLVRTEHMFLSSDRRLLLMRVLLAEGEDKTQALRELTNMHTKDLEAVLAHGSKSFPITIRLFDFPPAEFFPSPQDANAIREIADRLKIDERKIHALCERIHSEQLRGVAFSLAFPEIAQAQCESIFTAAKQHPDVEPKIMIPVVRSAGQVTNMRKIIDKATNGRVYRLGVMAETKELASDMEPDQQEILKAVVKQCDFISIGSNDLTEELLGVKRGDPNSIVAWSHFSREPINPFDELAEEVCRAAGNVIWGARSIKPKIEISLCGDQATSRSTAEFCQQSHIHFLSVPASEELLTQTLVETGRSALLESTKQSELRDKERRGREQAEAERTTGKVPGNVEILSPHVLAESPVAFVIIEDEAHDLGKYRANLTGLPVVLCTTISDALKAIDALHMQGKGIHIYTDANVPVYAFGESLTCHPLCEHIRTEQGSLSTGAQLAWMAHARGLHDVLPENVTLLSYFNTDKLPEGTGRSLKMDDPMNWMREDIDETVRLKKLALKRSDKAVIIVDDDADWAADCRAQLERRFNCPIEIFPGAQGVVERVKKGGVAAVLSDQLMPGMAGNELAERLRKETPKTPVAILTGSDEFIEEHPFKLPDGTLVMSKREVASMHALGGRLKTFLLEALDPNKGLAA